jgi:hypothetical protein
MNGDRLTKFVSPYGYRHPRFVAWVRTGVGVWLLILTGILYGSGTNGWWALVLVPGAALNFYLAYRARAISERTNLTDARQS